MIPDISIIIPAFNVEKYLGATIESILLQDHKSLEVLVVDDHSTDGTKLLAEKYAAFDHRIRVLTNEGAKGAGGARNTALAHMRGKTCFFLDGDDLLLPGALKALYSLIEKSGAPLVRGIGSAFCQQRWLFITDSPDDQKIQVRYLPAGHPTVGFCNHLYDSGFLKANNIIFPEHLPIGQDGPFLCKAYSLVETIPFINQKIFIYRINHKPGIPSGIKAISAINYFLLAREHFDRAGKHDLVAPYLKLKFQHQWLVRAHAAGADSRETALLFMQKCANLLHDMEDEVRPFLDKQMGGLADRFWDCCRSKDAAGMLAAVEKMDDFKPQSVYIGIDRHPEGPKWLWYRFSRCLASLVRKPETIKVMLYLKKLHRKSTARLAAGMGEPTRIATRQAGRDIIVFSDDWGRHPFSCQHIMEHFLPGNRLLWVNTIGLRTPSLTIYDAKRSLEKIASWLRPRKHKESETRHDNLRILSPFMIPYNTMRPVRAFNKNSVISCVRKAMRDWNFKSPVLLATQPLASDYVGHLGESLVVYYCVDDFTLWPGMNQPELVRALENTLLTQSDLVVAVSDSLCATRSNGKEATRLLTHGVDIGHFKRAALPQPLPTALQDLAGPVIGFYGLIDDRFDRELTKAVLDARPDWQIVCIGTRRVDLAELEKRPNFHWLPPVPYAELPFYAAGFDAAIIPYKVNAHSQTINPLKLKEYLATNKPVVSTPLAEVLRFADLIFIANDAPAFVNAIEKALAAPPDATRRAEALAGESWQEKATRLGGWIKEALERKANAVRKTA